MPNQNSNHGLAIRKLDLSTMKHALRRKQEHSLLRKSTISPLRGGFNIGPDFPIISLAVLITGFSLLSKLLFYERKLYRRCCSSRDVVSWRDYIEYRLDCYFALTSWTKPLILLTFAYVLIFASTFARVTLLNEDFASASWRSWTYVADSGISSTLPRT
jgi:hypothetical protein